MDFAPYGEAASRVESARRMKKYGKDVRVLVRSLKKEMRHREEPKEN